jgi:hypothetical protein
MKDVPDTLVGVNKVQCEWSLQGLLFRSTIDWCIIRGLATEHHSPQWARIVKLIQQLMESLCCATPIVADTETALQSSEDRA